MKPARRRPGPPRNATASSGGSKWTSAARSRGLRRHARARRRDALTQARESQRIVRERYDAGLASATDLLRAGEAVFDAEARATAADMDVILETVALDRAAGRL